LGLIAMTTALLVQPARFLRRFPVKQWSHPSLVSATGFALVLMIFVLDGLINGMLNVLYVIAAGGLANVVTRQSWPYIEKSALPTDQAARMAAHSRDAVRVLKSQGRFVEAKTAWLLALDSLSKTQSNGSAVPALDGPWCDCANDLAWLLATAP